MNWLFSKPWLSVAFKEILDLSRDKRSLTNVFVMGALVGPLLAMGMLSMTLKSAMDEAQKALHIPIVGAANAPGLVRHLAQHDIHVSEFSGDVVDAVKGKQHEVALVIPEQYAQRLSASKPAFVEMIFDDARNKSTAQKKRLEKVIAAYSRTVGSLRLIARGVDPAVASAVLVKNRDTSSTGLGGRLLGMLPFLLIIGLIQASMFIAADVTAGERERQTLEPLLINPVSPAQIMAGKLLVNIVTCIAVVCVSSVAFVVATKSLPTADLGIKIDPTLIPSVLLALLPLALVISPLMTFLGAFAKSVREAQTYLSVVVLVAFIPSTVQMVLQMQVESWQLLIPLWSQNHLVNELFRGVDIPLYSWLLSLAGALLAGSVFTWLAARQYRNPKLIFAG